MPDNVPVSLLQGFVARAEGLTAEKAAIESDLSELYAEVKGAGFTVKAFKALLTRRAKDAVQVDEETALVDLYEAALRRA